MTQYRISVRALVEFILRSGDIRRQSGVMDQEAMLKGARLHRKLQKQMGGSYQAEVSLKLATEYPDLTLVTEGRADGVFTEFDLVWVDEIKGVYASLNRMEEPVPVHRAQAMCYAHFLCESRGLSRIGVQMTYANLDTEEIRRFRELFSAGELKEWFRGVADAYHAWLSYQQEWIGIRNSSMKGLEFPFTYREGQRKMVHSVYHAIASKKQIFIQAPTGIGKTMSTVFPAVRAVGEGLGGTIFYLTAKTIARTVAQEAFDHLRRYGLRYKVITLTAKEKLCPNEEMICDPEHCPRAKGHFDRVNEAVFTLWTGKEHYSREELLEHAEAYQVCPFEMSLDLAVWTDAVIADYNYVFDPDVSLKRFFAEGAGGDYLFLIDEAHNLVERAREMYSASLCREDVLAVIRDHQGEAPRLAKLLRRVAKHLLVLKKVCCDEVETFPAEDEEEKRPPIKGCVSGRHYAAATLPQSLILTLLQVKGELDALLEEPPSETFSQEILDFYFQIRTFLNVCELLDDSYQIYTEEGEDNRFRLELYCVNPASRLADRLACARSTVFFSATLHPLDYYRRLLSTREDDYGIYLPSPFPADHRLILTGTDVSSRYTRRGASEYERIARYIAAVALAKRGNYLVFFPSYRMLEDVMEHFTDRYDTGVITLLRQTPSMREAEREAFLAEFQEEGWLLGFAIMGGIFSEGIDLIGDRLIGSIVVGTGLPQLSGKRELLKAWYDARGMDGFDYAYRYPGMNKVLQAAGRVVRTQTDRGVILLLDSRFAEPSYRPLFPQEWEDRRRCGLGNVEKLLRDFWEQASGEAGDEA